MGDRYPFQAKGHDGKSRQEGRKAGQIYEACSAKIRMYRMVLKEGRFDENVHHCSVISYKPEEECLYLIAEDTELTEFSQDGKYECRIKAPDGEETCMGVITDRYWNKSGRILKFRIKNGFYKNLVN